MSATGTNEQLRRSITSMFAAFPSQERTGDESLLVKLYLVAVDGVPEFIVRTACRRFVQGLVDVSSLKFRPTPAEFAAECRRIQERELELRRVASLQPRERVPRLTGPRPRFRPYPKLWETFAGEPEIVAKLDDLDSFDKMTRSSRLFATAGIDEARKFIQQPGRAGRPATGDLQPLGDVMPSRVDLADFPPANATRAELKDWEKRQKEAELEPEPQEAAP